MSLSLVIYNDIFSHGLFFSHQSIDPVPNSFWIKTKDEYAETASLCLCPGLIRRHLQFSTIVLLG